MKNQLCSIDLLENIVKGIDDAFIEPQRILNRIYNFDMTSFHIKKGDPTERDELESLLSGSLSLGCEQIALYLELIGLEQTRMNLLEKWNAFGTELGKAEWWNDEEEEGLRSKPLDYLSHLRSTIAALLPQATSPQHLIKESYELKRLEYVLRCTAQILRNMGVNPAREHDIEDAMNKHLRTVFDDYTTTLSIPKPITSFKPDGGVISLRAAIEFKFCDTEKKTETAVRGINEDVSGYSGSADWTRFYSVAYQTEPFTTEGEFQRSLTLSGNAEKWSIIVVTGGKEQSA